MTRQQALTAMRKLYGKSARVALCERALPSAERAKLPAFKDLPIDDRWKKAARRCSVGHAQFGFFMVTGRGDNWAEAVREAQMNRKGVSS